MVRPPQNLSNTLSFKSGVIKTGADVLETELLAEKAYSLGLAAKSLEKSLAKLYAFEGSEKERLHLLQRASDATHDFFIQREMMGFSNHDHPIEFYEITNEVLSRVGAKSK